MQSGQGFDEVPDAVLTAARALRAQAESRRAAATLRSVGIPVLVLKGPDLQERLYGTPAAYASGDVDLLVPRHMAGRARRALVGDGWAFEPENGVLWRLSRAASFQRDDLVLDLHWGLHASHLPAWSLRRLERRMWEGARTGPGGMLEPDAESLLVYLAVHAVGHSFERPEWGEIVHRAAAQVPDPEKVRRIAREARVEGAVRAALGRDDAAPDRLLDGSWGRLVSGSAWLARGHFFPQSVRTPIRRAVSACRAAVASIGRRIRRTGPRGNG
jgi:hypothetical protein